MLHEMHFKWTTETIYLFKWYRVGQIMRFPPRYSLNTTPCKPLIFYLHKYSFCFDISLGVRRARNVFITDKEFFNCPDVPDPLIYQDLRQVIYDHANLWTRWAWSAILNSVLHITHQYLLNTHLSYPFYHIRWLWMHWVQFVEIVQTDKA